MSGTHWFRNRSSYHQALQGAQAEHTLEGSAYQVRGSCAVVLSLLYDGTLGTLLTCDPT